MNKKKFYKSLGVLAGVGLLFTVASHVVASEEYDEDTYGPEAAVVWQKPVKGVTFSHKLHTMDLGMECDSCHDGLFEMEAGVAADNDDFTMAAMAQGKYCGSCHNGDDAFDANSQCTSCHQTPDDFTFAKPVKAVIFGHKLHSELGMECASCHDDLFKMEVGASESHPEKFTMQALYDGKYCGACHDGETAFASNTRCTVCHIGVKGFDRFKGGQSGDDGHGGGGHH